MKKAFIIVAVVAIISVAYSSRREVPNSYDSSKYGISFGYPTGYVLSEGERGDAHRDHYSMTLVKADEAVPPVDGEGPTAITVDIYQNNLDQLTLMKWVKETDESNYKLSGKHIVSTKVQGEDALTYEWSGLYEGKTTVFRHNGNIIAIAVTYMNAQDPKLSVYAEVMQSLHLQDAPLVTQEAATAFVQGMYPELADYPSENLPPRKIQTQATAKGWNIGFLTYGSGLPGILSAVCYSVSNSKEVVKMGEYSRGAGAAKENLNLATCKP